MIRKIAVLLLAFILILNLAACSGSAQLTTTASEQESAAAVASETTAATLPTASAADAVASATQVLAENQPTHADADDYTWDNASVVSISFDGTTISADGEGVRVDGSQATITAAGTYSLSGTLTDGQVVVDTADETLVRLILNGVNLSNSTGSPLSILNAKKAVLVLADQTENTVSDAGSYVYADPTVEEPNAAIFSAADLTIWGGGTLTVTGNANDGISSKDGLLLAGGTLQVTAVDDGIRGKDYIVVEDGNISVTAQGNGLKADNAEDAERGYIAIEGGTLNVTTQGDAIQAATDVAVTGGEITISAGGGSAAQIGTDTSAKGIKGAAAVNIDGGTFVIDAADDAIHTNGNLVINGGTFTLATGDDGMHADASLTINGGDYQITGSYEGIESAQITINDGNIHVHASDDGVNVAGGQDGSGMNAGFMPGNGARLAGGPGQDAFAASNDNYLHINGGYLAVDANGDGIDVGGAIEMTGGVVLVNGPTEQMNGAIDYDGGFAISGGLLVATGSSGMAEAPDQSSSQNSVLVFFDSTLPAGTLVHIQDESGADVLTFAPTKDFQSLAFSSVDLAQGGAYTVYTGGSATGTVNDSLIQDGAYTPGSQAASFTVSGSVTQVGSGGMMGGGPGGHGGGGGRP
jgi:hypothetical protein